MSDRDMTPEPPDPIDQAARQAEAMLDDDAARAARRARVLAAVAQAAPAEPIAAPPPAPRMRRSPWRRGGWLAAASIAGLSVLVASQVYRLMPPPVRTETSAPAATPTPPRPAAAAPPSAAEVAPSAATPSAPPQGPVTEQAHRTDVTPPPMNAPAPAPPPPPPAPNAEAAPAPPPSAASAPAPFPEAPETVVVTAERRAAPPERAPEADQMVGAQAFAGAAPADRGERLRAAAAAGRTGELETLLDQGVPVDAPDTDGTTALMRSIQAERPEAAALLVRHGASLNRTNQAGQSARDMATQKGDPALSRALGLTR